MAESEASSSMQTGAPATEEAPAVESAAPAPEAAAAPESATTDGAADADADDGGEGEEDSGPVKVMWCSGDAPGSTTQHNFEGEWKLDDEREPLINGRPHYWHHTPDKTEVHLFFVEQQAPSAPGAEIEMSRAPRWMVGPVAGNGANGWAYSDSDAPDPTQIIEPWLAWDKSDSSWREARLAYKEKGSNVSNDDDDDEEEEGGATDGSPNAGGAKKVKKKKKKAAAGGAAKGSSKSSGKKSARTSARTGGKAAGKAS